MLLLQSVLYSLVISILTLAFSTAQQNNQQYQTFQHRELPQNYAPNHNYDNEPSTLTLPSPPLELQQTLLNDNNNIPLDAFEHRAHDPTDELFNLVTENPKPKRPLEPVKKWFENFIQNVANNARTQPTHSPIPPSSSSHYPTTTRSPSVTPMPEVVSTTTSSSVSTSTSGTTTSTESSSSSSDSDHRHSSKSLSKHSRGRHSRPYYRHHHYHPHHHHRHFPPEPPAVQYIRVFPASPVSYQYPAMTVTQPISLPSSAVPLHHPHPHHAMHKASRAGGMMSDYLAHLQMLQQAKVSLASAPPPPPPPPPAISQQSLAVAAAAAAAQQAARQYYSQPNFIMIPGPTQAVVQQQPPPPPPPQYPYSLPVPVMSYPYTRLDVERHRTAHYAQQPSQPIPTKTRLHKYAQESSPSSEASQSPDDYDSSDMVEPVETRPALMFLDTQPSSYSSSSSGSSSSMDSESGDDPGDDSSADNGGGGGDDGQYENEPSGHSPEDKNAR